MFLASCLNKKKEEIQLGSLEKDALFEALFKPQQVIMDGECLWEPAKSDSSFPKSDDGLCHTRLDTILMFNENGINKAVIVFGTYEFIAGIMADCHGCHPLVSIAIFEKGDNNIWQLEKFDKNFCYGQGYGNMPGLSITKLGENYFLKESSYDAGMGYSGGGANYWCLTSLVKSFTTTFEDNYMRVTERTERHSSRDSIQDISANGKTKIMLLKLESSFFNGKDQERVTSKQECILNDSCIFRPVKNKRL